MIWIVKNLWLIPALPLVAAGVIAVSKQPQRKRAAALAFGDSVTARWPGTGTYRANEL